MAEHFLHLVCDKMNRPKPILTRDDIRKLCHYQWPGNVCELQNDVERAVIHSRGLTLNFDLPGSGYLSKEPVMDKAYPPKAHSVQIWTETQIQQAIRRNLTVALVHCAGKIYGPNEVAALLGDETGDIGIATPASGG